MNRLTPDLHDEFLLSLNLVNNTDVKKVKKVLYGISNNIYKNYKEFKIKKRNGKTRKICEPSKELKSIQRNILHNVLEEKKVSSYATAYLKYANLKDNAYPHVGKQIILKLDIKDFFNNITFTKVYESCFPIESYPKDIGMLLTNLCTYEETLPQGAPTSAYISNVVMRGFDEKVGKFCLDMGVSYTRYSDDMTFSGFFDVTKVIEFVKNNLKELGFVLNYDKIKVITRKSRQQVTGVVVNEKMSICKTYRKKIRQEMYYIKKYGVNDHLKTSEFKLSKEKYLLGLLGRINFVLQIDGDDNEFITYRNYAEKIMNVR